MNSQIEQNTTTEIVFSKEEKKIRKLWLITWIIALCLSIPLFVLSKTFVMFALWAWISYHCAYKKHGIIYVTIELILIATFILFNLINLKSFGNIVSLFFLPWQFYVDFKLRKINKTIKDRLPKPVIEKW